MEVNVYNIKGEDTGRKVTLNESIFGIEPNDHAIYLDVKQFMANQRQGTHKSKERSEISGSTRKIGRQKGGGGARRGDMNSPVLVGGARVFGPKPRDYSYTLPKKVKRLALKSAFSTKVADNDLIVVDNIAVEDYKTKTVVEMLSKLGADKKALIVMPEVDQKLIKSAANIPGVKTALVNTINVYDILNCDKFIVAKSALEKIEEVYA